MNEDPIGVFSVDDRALLREGIAAIINSPLVAQAATGSEAIRMRSRCRPGMNCIIRL